MDINDDLAFLEICYKMIEEKMEWGDSQNWTHYHYTKLSDTIFEASKISISALTLKRMFGKAKTYKENYLPHISTRIGLVLLLGYKNWDDFKLSQIALQKEENIVLSKSPNPKKNMFLFWMIAASALLASFIVFLFSKDNEKYLAKMKFSITNAIGYGPRTVVAQFEIDQEMTDSVKIDFSDPEEREAKKISPINHAKTHYYRLPGYYDINLLVHNRIIKQEHAHIFSRGWQPIVFYNVPPVSKDKKINRYNLLEKDSTKNFIFMDEKILQKSGFDTSANHWYQHLYINKFNFSLDNMTFETKVETSKKVENTDIMIYLEGEKKDLMVNFTSECCFQYSHIVLGDIHLGGKDNDLHMLAGDFSKFKTIQIKSKNQNIQISLEGNPSYQLKYKDKIGELKGIRIGFHGEGWIKYVSLSDSTGKQTHHWE